MPYAAPTNVVITIVSATRVDVAFTMSSPECYFRITGTGVNYTASFSGSVGSAVNTFIFVSPQAFVSGNNYAAELEPWSPAEPSGHAKWTGTVPYGVVTPPPPDPEPEPTPETPNNWTYTAIPPLEAVKYDPTRLIFNKLIGGAQLGYSARLGEMVLGGGTEQGTGTSTRVPISSFAKNDGYSIGDKGELSIDPTRGTASFSERLEGAITPVMPDMRTGDKFEVYYDGVMQMQGECVEARASVEVADAPKFGKEFVRTVTYTLSSLEVIMLNREVEHEALPEEPALERLQRFFTVDTSHVATTHMYQTAVLAPAKDAGTSTYLDLAREFTEVTKLPVRTNATTVDEWDHLEVLDRTISWPDQPFTVETNFGESHEWLTSVEFAENGTREFSPISAAVKANDLRLTGGQKMYEEGDLSPLGNLTLGAGKLGGKRLIVGFSAPGVVDVVGVPAVVSRVNHVFGNSVYSASIEFAPPIFLGAEISPPLPAWGEDVLVTATQHEAFPGMTRLANGDMFLVWRRGSSHGNTGYGQIYRTTSSDGLAWSAPTLAIARPSGSHDLRDPSITKLSSGSLLVTYFQWVSGQTNTAWSAKSTDNGATWSTPVQIATTSLSSPPVELGAGTGSTGTATPLGAFKLGVNGLGGSAGTGDTRRIVQATYGGSAVGCFLYYSDSGGTSWTKLSNIVSGTLPDGGQPQEPWLVLASDGTLICTIRSSAATGRKSYRCTSTDSGSTWSAPAELSYVSDSRISTVFDSAGKLHALYRGTDDYKNLYHRTSTDKGVTWSTPALVASVDFRNTYAAAVDVGNGQVGLVYGQEESSLSTSKLFYTRR